MEKEDLILKPAYRAMILLTAYFQEKTTEKGLRLLHYRFALVRKDDIESYWKREMEEFFGWKLRVYQDMNEITRCIPTRQALIERLHRLCDLEVLTPIFSEIVTINKEDRKIEYDPPIYRINPEHYKELDEIYRKHVLKTLCDNEIDKYPYEKLYELEEKINTQSLLKKLAENYPKYF